MSMSVILPAYMEAENLSILLPKIKQELSTLTEPYEVIVIDSRETLDNTEEACSVNQCTYIRRIGGDSYGDAIRTGIKSAKMDYLVTMDADGSHNPEDILKLYEAMKGSGCNVVIGSRYTKGGSSCNGIILKSMSLAVNIVYRVVFHIKARDVSNSFRVYRTKQIQSIKLDCDNFDIVEEILIRLRIAHPLFAIKEVPIYFNKRMYGKTKRDLWKFVRSYLVTIANLYKIQKKALKNKCTIITL